ncbi:MAG TPA: site-2 protease family protein [Thermoanaerobaculia bacterium]|nr:site-2 protease family protein [Thermoanaerobaculia bacterium]
MRGSFRFLRVAGIDLRVHYTFPLVLVYGAVLWSGPHGLNGALFGCLLMLALFACVVLHELGHSLVARRLGIPVREIVLLPIGGMALMVRSPRRPLHELLIAAAGPAVSALLAVAFYGLLTVSYPDLGRAAFQLVDPRQAQPSLSTLLAWLAASNLGLLLFNLIPAFPMDGGRMLRAILASFLGFRRATRFAAGLGQVVAMLLGAFAVINGLVLLAVVAVFIFTAAAQQRGAEEARGVLSTLRLGDAYNKYALVLAPGDRLSKVVDYLLTSYQPDFAVLHGGELLGVVTRNVVLRALAEDPSDPYVAGLMDRNYLRLDSRQSLAEAQELMAEQSRSVAAVFAGDRYLGLINLDDLREALQIAACLKLHEERGGSRLGSRPAA